MFLFYCDVALTLMCLAAAHGPDGNGDPLRDAVSSERGVGPPQDRAGERGAPRGRAPLLAPNSHTQRHRAADSQYCKYSNPSTGHAGL